MQFEYETHSKIEGVLPFVCALLSIRAGKTPQNVYVNWHENIEIIYCVDGEGEVLCGTDFLPIKKGSIVVVNSNLFHDIITRTKVDFYYLIVDNSFCRANGFDTTRIRFEELIDSEALQNAFNEVIEAYEADSVFKVAEVRYAVAGLMLELCKNHLSNTDSSSNDDGAKRIMYIIEYLKLHFTEKLTLEDIARQNGISRSYLVHEFKRYTKKTVVSYINILRCINARSLIQNGVSISEAAQASGFDNLSYFTRTYKKYMLVCPSEEKN